MVRNDEVHGQYLGATLSAEIAENFKELFPEHADLSYEEVLQQQESVYLSLQGNNRNKGTSDHGQSSDLNQFSGQEGESSQGESVESQLALDEAIARSLELGDNLDDLYISEPVVNAAGSTGETSSGTPVSSRAAPVRSESTNVSQDDIDPDAMTYEQLQSLGDSVGVESKGLSEDLISRLPSFKYKTGLFSKKKNIEECVICYMKYKRGDYLTTLPCAHQYHSRCITIWLKINKNCPVCQEEVREH